MTRRRTFVRLSFTLQLLLFYVTYYTTISESSASYIGSAQVQDVSGKKTVDGCIECGAYRCPENARKCLLGTIPDPCECCGNGLCARLETEPCWNSSIPELISNNRNDGLCGENYLCKLRSDLQKEDKPQAVCVCIEQDPVCGSNNKTYTTLCALQEEALKLKNSSSLHLQHLGPCKSRPWILSPLQNILATFGQRVALNCEAKGYPIPEIFWEFRSVDGKKIFKLPGEEHEATVHTSVDPEPLLRTSWLQLAQFNKKHIGTYYCIANNSLGKASTASYIFLL